MTAARLAQRECQCPQCRQHREELEAQRRDWINDNN